MTGRFSLFIFCQNIISNLQYIFSLWLVSACKAFTWFRRDTSRQAWLNCHYIPYNLPSPHILSTDSDNHLSALQPRLSLPLIIIPAATVLGIPKLSELPKITPYRLLLIIKYQRALLPSDIVILSAFVTSSQKPTSKNNSFIDALIAHTEVSYFYNL